MIRRLNFYLLLTLMVWVSGAAAQAPYYQGKTITIITGSQAGDLFDIYARMIATHISAKRSQSG